MLAQTHAKAAAVFGKNDALTIEVAHARAEAVRDDPALGKVLAETLLNDALFAAIRTFGARHETTRRIVADLDEVREKNRATKSLFKGLRLLDTRRWPLEPVSEDGRKEGG